MSTPPFVQGDGGVAGAGVAAAGVVCGAAFGSVGVVFCAIAPAASMPTTTDTRLIFLNIGHLQGIVSGKAGQGLVLQLDGSCITEALQGFRQVYAFWIGER